MTRPTLMNCLIVFVLAAILGVTYFAVDITLAQANTVATDAGAIAAPPASPVASSSSLADPTAAPLQAFDQLAALKRLGWPLALLAALIMLSRIGVTLAPKYALIAKLERGRRLMLVAGVGTVAAAMLNVVLGGGTWAAAVVGAAGVVFSMLSPHAPSPLQLAAKQRAIAMLVVVVAVSATVLGVVSCSHAQVKAFDACEVAVAKTVISPTGATTTVTSAVADVLAGGTAGISAGLLTIATQLGMPFALDSIDCAITALEGSPTVDAGSGSAATLSAKLGETRAQRIAAARAWVAQQRAAAAK